MGAEGRAGCRRLGGQVSRSVFLTYPNQPIIRSKWPHQLQVPRRRLLVPRLENGLNSANVIIQSAASLQKCERDARLYRREFQGVLPFVMRDSLSEMFRICKKIQMSRSNTTCFVIIHVVTLSAVLSSTRWWDDLRFASVVISTRALNATEAAPSLDESKARCGEMARSIHD